MDRAYKRVTTYQLSSDQTATLLNALGKQSLGNAMDSYKVFKYIYIYIFLCGNDIRYITA